MDGQMQLPVKMICVLLLVSFAGICEANAQGGQQQQPAQLTPEKPYRLASRIHVEKGTQKGYLIVQVDLLEGSYVYALTQKGQIPPSKLKVTRSPNFRMLGKFTPDRPALVIEHDPVYEQRIEKHKKRVQFFAPIEFAPGVDATKVVANVNFDGQVCTDAGFCMPIRDLRLSGKFSGYFQTKKGQQQAVNQPVGQGTERTASGDSQSLKR